MGGFLSTRTPRTSFSPHSLLCLWRCRPRLTTLPLLWLFLGRESPAACDQQNTGSENILPGQAGCTHTTHWPGGYLNPRLLQFSLDRGGAGVGVCAPALSCCSMLTSVHWPSCLFNYLCQCLVFQTKWIKQDMSANQTGRRGEGCPSLCRPHYGPCRGSRPPQAVLFKLYTRNHKFLLLPQNSFWQILLLHYTLHLDSPKGVSTTTLPNWLGCPNMKLREQSGHTGMDLGDSHLPNWSGGHVSATGGSSIGNDRNEMV